MTEISIHNINLATPGLLKIDIVLKFASELRHITTISQKLAGLYDVPLTRKAGVDIHTAYHPSGQMHRKLTKGKLTAIGEKITSIGEARYKMRAHDRPKGILLWEAQRQRWDELKGVEENNPHNGFVSIDSLREGYPVYTGTKADYKFEIEYSSCPSAMIDIKTFLVEPGNQLALSSKIQMVCDCWNRDVLNASLYSNEYLAVEKAELFTSLDPWLAIVLFVRRITDRESKT